MIKEDLSDSDITISDVLKAIKVLISLQLNNSMCTLKSTKPFDPKDHIRTTNLLSTLNDYKQQISAMNDIPALLNWMKDCYKRIIMNSENILIKSLVANFIKNFDDIIDKNENVLQDDLQNIRTHQFIGHFQQKCVPHLKTTNTKDTTEMSAIYNLRQSMLAISDNTTLIQFIDKLNNDLPDERSIFFSKTIIGIGGDFIIKKRKLPDDLIAAINRCIDKLDSPKTPEKYGHAITTSNCTIFPPLRRASSAPGELTRQRPKLRRQRSVTFKNGVI